MQQKTADKRLKNMGWKFYVGDVNWVDYGGTWIHMDPGIAASDTGGYVLSVQEYYDSDEDKMAVELCWVDYGLADSESLKSALEYTGIPLYGTIDDKLYALKEYGLSMPLSSSVVEESKVASEVVKIGTIFGRDFIREVSDKLGKRANKIGATWKDILKGDPLGGIRRTPEHRLTQAQKIVAKAYFAAGGQTLGGGEIDMDIVLKGGFTSLGSN